MDLDIVFVVHEKDLAQLHYALEGIQKNIQYRNIYIVSNGNISPANTNTNTNIIYFNENDIMPFTKQSIAMEMFHGNTEQANKFLKHPKTRIGWIFQQLCKLYSPFVIPNISENVLIVDADTIFLKPVVFFDPQDHNKALYNVGTEYHRPYFHHMKRVLPTLKRKYLAWSGITHHMLLQKSMLNQFFHDIRKQHQNMEPWKVFMQQIDLKEIYGSCLSEYEMYFNYVFLKCPDSVKIRKLKFKNLSFKEFKHNSPKDCDYVSCHAYLS